MAGDLNATPDSRVLADARTFLLDSFTGDPATGFTFPADHPTRRIDYILFTEHPGLRSTDCRVIAEPVASDHRPVLATFELATPCWPRASERSEALHVLL